MANEKPDIEIRRFVVGPIQTNCYAVVSNGHAIVIDPGAAGAAIARELGDVVVDEIIATHGHGDHVGGVKALADATGAPFWIGEPDAERATHSGSPGSLGIAYDDDAPMASRFLAEGDEVRVGDATFQVLEAPGHTPGGIVLLGEGVAFVGDTIFKGAVGRTDLPGGSPTVLAEALKRLRDRIPAETVLLPGHDDATTMADELRSNPYLVG